jgi:hypothetical protein
MPRGVEQPRWPGRGSYTALEIATVQQIRDRLLADGLTTEAEIEQHLANVAGGQLDLATAP